MPCNHPMKAFPTGHFTANGLDEYFIASQKTEMVSFDAVFRKFHHYPIGVPTKYLGQEMFITQSIPIPCGSCVGCRMAHAKEWATRCALEAKYHQHVWFVTLTYDDQHLPGDKLLHKEDLQNFFKRLRRKGYSFRYFACGEYGETYDRPHYHAIIFGLDLPDLTLIGKSSRLENLYDSDLLKYTWGKGFVSVGYADIKAMSYTAGYVEKKQKRQDDHRVKPFLVMSRKPAIGTLYLVENPDSIVNSGKVYGDFGTSHRARAPRHFLRKLKEADEYLMKGKSLENQERGKRYADLNHAVWNCTDDELIGFAKDELALQKLSKIERS